jgi:RNA polymerase sigma factor (sigma-70 family)
VSVTDSELFAQLYPGLLRFAAIVRPRGLEPEDLVQEAVARALALRPLTDLDDAATYLRTAMVRVASNAERGRRRADVRHARAAASAQTVDRYPSDLSDLLGVAPRARAILFLTIIEGETYRTAAPIVGCSESAARAIGSRALRALRQQVTDEPASEEAR